MASCYLLKTTHISRLQYGCSYLAQVIYILRLIFLRTGELFQTMRVVSTPSYNAHITKSLTKIKTSNIYKHNPNHQLLNIIHPHTLAWRTVMWEIQDPNQSSSLQMSRLRLHLLTSTTTKLWLLDYQNIDNHTWAISFNLQLNVKCLEKKDCSLLLFL